MTTWLYYDFVQSVRTPGRFRDGINAADCARIHIEADGISFTFHDGTVTWVPMANVRCVAGCVTPQVEPAPAPAKGRPVSAHRLVGLKEPK